MRQTPYLYHRHVSAPGLTAAVDIFKSKLQYLYFESDATIDLTVYTSPDSNWNHGRAFGPELEVRWERNGSCFELLLLTESDLGLPAGWHPIPEELECHASQVLLWGTHVKHLKQPHRLAGSDSQTWIETRIPRPLNYPVSGSPRWVRANVVIYRRQGQPILTRLVSVEGEANEPQPLW